MDLRLVPAAVLAWAAAWAVTGRIIPAWCLLVLMAVTATLGRRRPAVWATCIAVSGVTLMASGWVHVVTTSHPAVWCADGAHLTATVRIRAEPQQMNSRFEPQYRVTATALNVDARGTTWRGHLPVDLLVEDPGSVPRPGSVITVAGVGSARRDADRSVGTIRVDDAEMVSGPDRLNSVANGLRSGLVASMVWATAPQAALVPSLVVGDTSGLDDDTEEEFRRTGLTHVLAVSGSNFSLALAFTGWIARTVGVRGWWLRGLAVGVSVVFVITCRSEPSVLRASVMGLIALGATGLGSAAGRSSRHLAVAVVMLLGVDPWLARSWGFALSVAATAGIIWWSTQWSTHNLQWIPLWIRQSLLISCAAQLATQPMVTAISDQVSLIAPLANLCVGPFLGPVTVLGLGAATTSLVLPGAAQVVGWVAGWCTQPILLVAHGMSAVPGSTITWTATPASLGLLTAMCVVLGQWAVPVLMGRRWTSLLVVVSLIGALVAPPRQYGWPGQWAVVACDVGQGGAVAFRVDDSSAILVDVGPDPQLLRGCLNSLRIRQVPLLVVTHPHADHIGGLSALAGVPVDTAIVGDTRSAALVAETLGVTAVMATSGQVITVGQTQWETLAVGTVGDTVQESEGDSPAVNDAGVVGRVTGHGVRTMVTGDLEETGQRRLLEQGGDVTADVLVVPHHGSAHQDPEFIRAVGARVSLIQVGEHNSYGHPTRSALSLVESTGSLVWRTDRDGAVAVTNAGQRVITQR